MLFPTPVGPITLSEEERPKHNAISQNPYFTHGMTISSSFAFLKMGSISTFFLDDTNLRIPFFHNLEEALGGGIGCTEGWAGKWSRWCPDKHEQHPHDLRPAGFLKANSRLGVGSIVPLFELWNGEEPTWSQHGFNNIL